MTIFCKVKHPSEEEDTCAWLGFAPAVAFFCLVITIFYVFDATSVRSAVTAGVIAGATAGALI